MGYDSREAWPGPAARAERRGSAMKTVDAQPRSERVLVLLPEPEESPLRAVLGQAGLPSRFCSDVEEFARELKAGAEAALLTEESLQPAVMTRLIDLLGRQPPWSDFPLLIVFGGGGETPDTALRMLDMLEP